jgi:hypothetical protein
MHPRRRHAAARLAAFSVVLAALPLSGAECLGALGGADEERVSCEAVCAAEAQCELGRDEAACLAALCAEDGFRVLSDEALPDAGPAVAAPEDLESLSANDCMKAAEDCATLALCSCEDSCARVDDCTGSPDAACVDNCELLLEQDPSLYLENRCKMESTCADLAACGQVG